MVALAIPEPFLKSDTVPLMPAWTYKDRQTPSSQRVQREEWSRECVQGWQDTGFKDLLYEAQQGHSVLLPVGREVLGQGILDTAQLDGDLKTVGVQVVPVLHAAWTEKMNDI